MIVRDVLDFKRSRCFSFLAHLQRLSAVVIESERIGFAQRGWEGPILESSRCLGSLPCVSCYMGSKCQHKDTPENPQRYPKDHVSQLAQAPQLPVSFTFHRLPTPGLVVAIGGVRLMVGKIPELWFCCPCLCVSCSCRLGVSLLSLCSVYTPRVPGSGCESVGCGGGRDELHVLCLWQDRPRLPCRSTNTPCLPCCLPLASQEHLPSSSRSQSPQNSGIKILGCFTARFLCSTPHQNKLFS